MRLIQRDLHKQLRGEGSAAIDKIAGLTRKLDLAKLNEHPEPNGWSVAQTLEHLIIADELYEAPLAMLLNKSRPDAGAPSREWKSSFLGGLIAESLINPKALKSPKVFRPGPTPRNATVETLLTREKNFLKAMDDAGSFDWRALRIKSPALPGWAPSMNVGDGFRIHIVHLTRHAKQVERLVGKLR